jgi:tetratricopeptide (TPR) repeat protein
MMMSRTEKYRHTKDCPNILRLLPSAFCLLLLAAAGCATPDVKAERAVNEYYSGNFHSAQKALVPVAKKTDENYVLNNDRLGSSALADYDLDQAERALLKSYEVINSTGVNDPGRAFNAAVVGESNKIWKGEPFERAMTNFYLGLVYYMEGDFNNSRGAFENALFKLRDYGDADKPDQYQEFESNFTLAYLMLAKSWQHLGRDDKAQDMFATVAKLRPDLQPTVAALSQPDDNVLLVIDWGMGPRKIENGDHAFVGFGPLPQQAGLIPPPYIFVDGAPAQLSGPPQPPVDLLALAQDRKWQDIDTIRAIKSVLGKGLVGAGAVVAAHGSGFTGHSHNGNDVAAGLGLIAAGALLDASSQADLRQWEMLPRTTYLIPLRLPPGPHEISVRFPGGESQTWQGLIAPDKGEFTYYYRMTQYPVAPRQWPPPALADRGAGGAAGGNPPPPSAVNNAPSPAGNPAANGSDSPIAPGQ